MCTATKSISKSGNMSCYQHVAHAGLATLARALSHSLTLKPGSARRLTDCTRARSFSLSLSLSAALPLSLLLLQVQISHGDLCRGLCRVARLLQLRLSCGQCTFSFPRIRTSTSASLPIEFVFFIRRECFLLVFKFIFASFR